MYIARGVLDKFKTARSFACIVMDGRFEEDRIPEIMPSHDTEIDRAEYQDG